MSKPRVYKLRVHLPPGVGEQGLKKEVTNNIKRFIERCKVDKKRISSQIKKLKSGDDGSIFVLLTITVVGTVLADVAEHLFREYVLQPIVKKWKTEREENG